MSTEITTKDPCPLCLNNGVVNQLMDRPGQFFTNCKAGHKFEDTEELNMLRSQARSKFPNFYKAPDAPTLMDPAVRAAMNIVIDPETRKAIEEITGVPLTGGADLKGTIFAYVTDNKDKDAEIRSLRAQITTVRSRAAVRPGGAQPAENQILLDLPEWAIEGGLAEQAQYSDKTVQEWCQEEFNAYLGNYFSRTPQRT